MNEDAELVICPECVATFQFYPREARDRIKWLEERLRVQEIKLHRLHGVIWQGNDPFTMTLLNDAINTPIDQDET